MDAAQFDEFILANMPHFIAVNYRQLLEAQTSKQQVGLALHIYNIGLRVLTIGLVSQYLIRDRGRVRDSYLNELLLQKFPHLTLDAWQQILFAALRAYEGNQKLFFMQELYDFYWDTSILPHKQRIEVHHPFERLTQISVEIQTERFVPQNEAEWTSLAEESIGLLQQILRGMVFLQKYDLIRVLDLGESFYNFELHKGLSISTGRGQLSRQVELTRGWFYLREGTEEFLLLHPFLVFWEGEAESGGLVPTDIAVYERFIYQRLQYLLATLGKTIVDEKSVEAFIAVLYETIEEIKRRRQEAEKLRWWQLRDICAQISRQRMSTVRHKYRADLYLQRNKTRQAFEQFLKSDKRCFVLIGKSGVGKSNFLIALGDELAQSNSNVCVLMYDGGNLKVQPSLAEVISRDFDDRLILAGRRINDILREIAQVDGISERLIILYVDAINENPQAKELLRQLDELVQKPWPWLKVVFSSRPETWQAIKRGVRLAEALYYREEGTEVLGIELEPFSYSDQIEHFTRQELQEAYTKYQQVFSLQTDYTVLSGDLREILRDPLSLQLVAQTYREQAIPHTLKVTELIEKYLNTLLQSDRLQKDDLRLLEKDLTPLMVKNGLYSNAITASDIDAVGGSLYEAIYNEQVLSDGRRVNQSFSNLLDANILVRQGEGQQQKIAFKYERFYEYFVGRQIFELSGGKADRPQFFAHMINETNKVPFLWGAVRDALIEETRERGTETVLALCFTDQQRVKEMMVNMLVNFGRDNPSKIELILKDLISLKMEVNRFNRRRLFTDLPQPAKEEDGSQHYVMAKRIAIEVSAEFRMNHILELAARDSSPSVRIIAVQYIYYDWRQDRDSGFNTLKNLSINIRGRFGLPNINILEPCMGISALILFNHYQERSIRESLQQIWRGIIQEIIPLVPREHKGLFNKYFTRVLVFIMVRVIKRTLFQTSSEYNCLNIDELTYFFRVKKARTPVLSQLLPYIDPEYGNSGDLDQLLGNTILAFNDVITQMLTLFVLTVRLFSDENKTLPMARKLYNKIISNTTDVPFNLHAINWSLHFALSRQNHPSEMLDLLEEVVWYFWDNSHGRYSTETRTYKGVSNIIDRYLYFHEKKYGYTHYPRLEAYIQAALKNEDFDFVRDSLHEISSLGSREGHPKLALQVLELFLAFPQKEIRESILTTLAQIRMYYADEVDNFLEIHEFEDNERAQVKAHTPLETIGDILIIRGAAFAVDALLLEFPEMRSLVQWIFQRALDSSSSDQWLELVFMKISNLVYGEELFKLPG